MSALDTKRNTRLERTRHSRKLREASRSDAAELSHLNARNLIMICFEVQINGKEICRAGLGDFGVLSCLVSWVNNRNRPLEDGAKSVSLNVGGLTIPENQTGEFVTWVRESLTVGDEVRMKIVEAIDADGPVERQPGHREPYCSFCGKVASQVSKINEAPKANICSECVFQYAIRF